jgi:pilus assembly protein Flp/PilA
VKICFRRLFTRLLEDESGQDLIEYALIAAIIGLGAAATLRSFAATMISVLTSLGSRLTASV